jgi:hypothetical protein
MNPAVAEKIHAYPADIRNRLLFLRQLILAVAEETDGVEGLQETIKWSQPSFVSTFGSTIRIDWNANTPDRYFMFFHCQTRLVETFRVLYEGLFQFEGNRAIVFNRDKDFPVTPLKHCISLALLYHKVKHQPLLGV